MILDGVFVDSRLAAVLARPLQDWARAYERTNGIRLQEPIRQFVDDLGRVALGQRVRPERDGTPRNTVDDAVAHDAPVTFSTKEAAGLLGISERAVRALCERGTLEATRPGGRWKIDGASLAAEVAERTTR
jgi:excisionase family DNA binding protein